MSGASAGDSPTRRILPGTFVAALQLPLVVLLGTAVRLVGWSQVFTLAGVRFVVDTDPN